MVRRQALAENTEKSHKIEHQTDILEQIHRSNAILINTIKTLETQLQTKGVLQGFDGSFYPVWFLGEQERNVFLWRKGCSIIEASDYEFWVDLAGLIEKRKKNLSNGSLTNPFTNPQWNGDEIDDELPYRSIREKELRYLETFQEVFKRIQEYASAFSVAASDAMENESTMVRVLLPQSPPLQPGKEQGF